MSVFGGRKGVFAVVFGSIFGVQADRNYGDTRRAFVSFCLARQRNSLSSQGIKPSKVLMSTLRRFTASSKHSRFFVAVAEPGRVLHPNLVVRLHLFTDGPTKVEAAARKVPENGTDQGIRASR